MSCPYEIQNRNLIRPVYRALKHFNKPVKIGDIEEFVIQDLKLPPEVYNLISNVKNHGKDQTELHFQLGWLKVNFKNLNVIENIVGLWKLTDETDKLTEDEVFEKFECFSRKVAQNNYREKKKVKQSK